MAPQSASFIIEPYLKASAVRSPLGFMSQATYWAQLLFPGVTVLTRHFLHVELLLSELRRRQRAGDSQQKIRQTLGSATTHARLEREYKQAVGEELDDVVTKVTYWQRYASLFDYFGLWNAPRNLRRDELWQIVFQRRVPTILRMWVKPEPIAARRRRIIHTHWYLQFQKELHEATEGVPPDLLWWVTGEGGPADASSEIKLSRRLSYAFLVWQTLFEVGIQLRLRGLPLPRASSRSASPRKTVDLLFLATQGEPSSDALRAIFSGLLSAHANELRQTLPRWQRAVERQTWYKETLTKLYDGTPVENFARVPASLLFSRLVQLHQSYCRAQGKTEAEYVRKIGSRFEAIKAAKITAFFNQTPWGLFGYRLDQSARLYESRRTT